MGPDLQALNQYQIKISEIKVSGGENLPKKKQIIDVVNDVVSLRDVC